MQKGNVRAGSTIFPNYDKVIPLTKNLVAAIVKAMKTDFSPQKQVDLSFDVHYNLVSIHPFYDGNGRTSRLLMNDVQAYYKLPLAIAHKESKVDYINALQKTKESDDIEIFRDFMEEEYTNFLKNEIRQFQEATTKTKIGLGFNLF